MAEEPQHPVDPDRIRPRDWLKIGRAVPAACDLRKILLAALGLVALELGWRGIERGAPDAPRVLGFASLYGTPFESPVGFAEAIRRPAWNVTQPIRLIVEPLATFVAVDGPNGRALPALLRLIWAFAAMGLVGGAICRMAIVEAATGAPTGLRESLGFALRHGRSLVAAPLHPLALVLMLAAVSAGFGLAARLVPALTAVLFVAPFVLAIASAVLLFDMIASWPLIPAAIAAESDLALEAVGRTFGYVNRRPLTLAAGATAAWILGTLGLAAFEVFLAAVVHLGVWGMGLAAYPARPGSLGGAIEPWAAVVGLACQAWAFAFFWCAAARVYGLLRQDVDGAPVLGVLPASAGDGGGSAALR
ncbi:hypothetical protein [Paludisphaera mucosa]|uniref:Uncharacterized protein n=1 Tax=Paludisphaera mucosa TaxID=3030827 RepID=A0ABT6F501_9BACT|nr:hypothetical protein [Paludisphaera mucosa]MDG3002662.1 hypothetical protein [Paludisphaera mucosa]